MLIIGDVHGCFKTLERLPEKCPPDNVCFTGDLIDRGNYSRQVVELVRTKRFYSVLGNHEQMMVQYFEENNHIWRTINGGEATLRSYGIKHNKPASSRSRYAPEGLVNHPDYHWLKSLLLYLEFPRIINPEGRYLVVSHSAAGRYWHYRNSNEKEKKHDLFVHHTLWGRSKDIPEIPGAFNVFGHTPREEVETGDHWANVDTGCYLPPMFEMGTLSALRFPQMEIYTQKNIDN